MQGKVVHHYRNVAVAAIEQRRLAAEYARRRVHSGEQPLRGSFLVARRAVDLPGAIEARNGAELQVRPERARIDVVVLDGITGHDHLDPLKPLHRPQHGQLDVGGKRGADSVGIDEVCRQPLRLEEHLVTVTVAEAVNLVLDRRTVTRPRGLDRAGEQRRAMQVGADDRVARRIGPGDRTEHLRMAATGRQRRHRPRVGVRRLLLEARPVDRASVEPRRSPGLEPGYRQRDLAQLRGESPRGTLADSPTGHPLLAAEKRAAEEGAGAQHHRRSLEPGTVGKLEPAHHAALEHKRRGLALDQLKAGLRLDRVLDRCLEQRSVSLNPRPPDRAALRAIEHPVMDRRGVCRARDQPVEGIDLAHQVPLAEATDRRVAAHSPDCVEIEADEADARIHPRSHGGRLAAGMAAPDDEEIVRAHAAPLIGSMAPVKAQLRFT